VGVAASGFALRSARFEDFISTAASGCGRGSWCGCGCGASALADASPVSVANETVGTLALGHALLPADRVGVAASGFALRSARFEDFVGGVAGGCGSGSGRGGIDCDYGASPFTYAFAVSIPSESVLTLTLRHALLCADRVGVVTRRLTVCSACVEDFVFVAAAWFLLGAEGFADAGTKAVANEAVGTLALGDALLRANGVGIAASGFALRSARFEDLVGGVAHGKFRRFGNSRRFLIPALGSPHTVPDVVADEPTEAFASHNASFALCSKGAGSGGRVGAGCLAHSIWHAIPEELVGGAAAGLAHG